MGERRTEIHVGLGFTSKVVIETDNFWGIETYTTTDITDTDEDPIRALIAKDRDNG